MITESKKRCALNRLITAMLVSILVIIPLLGGCTAKAGFDQSTGSKETTMSNKDHVAPMTGASGSSEQGMVKEAIFAGGSKL